MLQIIISALAAIIADEKIRQHVIQLFANTPKIDSGGGMTLDFGSGPIVVCYGKPSLADEKRLRAELRLIDSKAKLSRTNNVKTRCEQYDIASNAKDWQRMFGTDKPKATAKAKAKPEATPVADTMPVGWDKVDPPAEQS